MARYIELLSDFSLQVGLNNVEALLSTQEVLIEGKTIGLMCESDPQADGFGDLIYFSNAGCLTDRSRTVEVYRFLLGANAFWQGTAGYTLGLQGPSDSVVISGRLPLSLLTGEILDRVLRRFSRVVGEWADMLEPEPELATDQEVDRKSDIGLVLEQDRISGMPRLPAHRSAH